MMITPTNAYYRFLVRRGPKGHVLAALTLVAVQWIHAYLPRLYRSVAAILLKLRIYDPRALRERERQRQFEIRYGKPAKKKKGLLTSKLFGSGSLPSQAIVGFGRRRREPKKRRRQRALDRRGTRRHIGGGVGQPRRRAIGLYEKDRKGERPCGRRP